MAICQAGSAVKAKGKCTGDRAALPAIAGYHSFGMAKMVISFLIINVIIVKHDFG